MRISAGLLVWALHFAAVYILTALACARGLRATPTGVPALALGIATLTGIAIAALALILRKALHGTWYVQARAANSSFLAWLTAAVAGYALLAVLWTALPALWGASCRS